MMSTLSHLFDLPEQICYVQCGFCSTILMVSVPCSSLSMVVTVRCGHCTSLLSVNMIKASFVPFHLLTSLTHLHQPKEGSSAGEDANKSTLNSYNNNNESMMMSTYSDGEEENNNVTTTMTTIVNKPPDKRPRTPSAYNCFIKEEIRRLKAENPSMAHKEAFSTAAKNWANFPPSECRGDGKNCSQRDQIVDKDSHLEPHDGQMNMKKAKVCVEERFKGSTPSWDARTSFELS